MNIMTAIDDDLRGLTCAQKLTDILFVSRAEQTSDEGETEMKIKITEHKTADKKHNTRVPLIGHKADRR